MAKENGMRVDAAKAHADSPSSPPVSYGPPLHRLSAEALGMDVEIAQNGICIGTGVRGNASEPWSDRDLGADPSGKQYDRQHEAAAGPPLPAAATAQENFGPGSAHGCSKHGAWVYQPNLYCLTGQRSRLPRWRQPHGEFLRRHVEFDGRAFQRKSWYGDP